MKGTQQRRLQSGSTAGPSGRHHWRCPATHARRRGGGGDGGYFRDGLQSDGSFGEGMPKQSDNLADMFESGRIPDLGRGIQIGPDEPAKADGPDPLNWDPEGLYKNKGRTTMQDGHIERRRRWRDQQDEDDAEKAEERRLAEQLKEAEERRASIEMPTAPEELLPFFLDAHAEDMEYYIAKATPHMGEDGKAFFTVIDAEIGEQRLLDDPDQDRIDDLEGLRIFVQQTLAAQAKVKRGVANATERLKKLLTASDMKATILDMAGKNEIDPALLQLLAQNVEGARAAGQTQAADFMAKVRDACAKYYIAPDKGARQDDQVRRVLRDAEAAREGGGSGGNSSDDGSTVTPGGVILPS